MHKNEKFSIEIIGSRNRKDHLKFNKIFIHVIGSGEYQRTRRIAPDRNFRTQVGPTGIVEQLQLLMFLVGWPNFCNANEGKFLNICGFIECPMLPIG